MVGMVATLVEGRQISGDFSLDRNDNQDDYAKVSKVRIISSHFYPFLRCQ